MALSSDLLHLFQFGSGNDVAQSSDSWRVRDIHSVNTKGGNDKIVGVGSTTSVNSFNPDRELGLKNRGSIIAPSGTLSIQGFAFPSKVRFSEPAYGLVNEFSGKIITADEKDFVSGVGKSTTQRAWGLFNGTQPTQGIPPGSAEINTRGGNDVIRGKATSNSGYTHGIHNRYAPAEINTGDGNDLVSSVATSSSGWSTGLRNSEGAKINTEAGNDRIVANASSVSARSYGIHNLESGSEINTGEGRDVIVATARGTGFDFGIYSEGGAKIDTGGGNDRIKGTAISRGNARGIWNKDNSEIVTGSGNDVVIGEAKSTGKLFGIYNDGIISTGTGNDTVDAKGGFGGNGTTLLGEGGDFLKGFGSGKFYGGSGDDRLMLDTGDYTISLSGKNGSAVISSGRTSMNVYEFEAIGGLRGQAFGLRAGEFKVNTDGVGSY